MEEARASGRKWQEGQEGGEVFTKYIRLRFPPVVSGNFVFSL